MAATITGDIRGPSVEQRRDKERRVRNSQVNANLLGTPIDSFTYGVRKVRGAQVWNNNNKYKMSERPSNFCHCNGCRRMTEQSVNKRRKQLGNDIYDVICTTGPGSGRKSRYLDIRDELVDEMDAGNFEEEHVDGIVDGVAYSYDNDGPVSTTEFPLVYAVTQAVEKFQSKELADLVKREYEFVCESDTDEDFEMV